MNFFPGQGKVRESSGWPGKFRKDLEKSGNWKIYGYGRQSSEILFIVFKREKDVLSQRKSKHMSLLIGATLKRNNLLPWGTNSFL